MRGRSTAARELDITDHCVARASRPLASHVRCSDFRSVRFCRSFRSSGLITSELSSVGIVAATDAGVGFDVGGISIAGTIVADSRAAASGGEGCVRGVCRCCEGEAPQQRSLRASRPSAATLPHFRLSPRLPHSSPVPRMRNETSQKKVPRVCDRSPIEFVNGRWKSLESSLREMEAERTARTSVSRATRWRSCSAPTASDGDLAARERLIEAYLPLAQSLARRFAHRGSDVEDLVQVGSIGLIKAVDRFEPCARRGPRRVRCAEHRRRDQASPARPERADPRAATRTGGQTAGDDATTHSQAHARARARGRSCSGPERRELADAARAEQARFQASEDRVARLELGLRELAPSRAPGPALPLLRRHEPDRDRRAARDLADACVPSARLRAWRSSARIWTETRISGPRSELHSGHGDSRRRHGTRRLRKARPSSGSSGRAATAAVFFCACREACTRSSRARPTATASA